MARPVRTAVILTLALALAGCGTMRESRLNPFNWFKRSVSTPTTLAPEGGYGDKADGRILVGEVTRLEVTRMPGGAIVAASGLPPTQGWWDAELLAENGGKPDEKGVMTYRFVVASPREATRVSTPQSREVTAGAFLSNIDLETISRIVVVGERNSRSSGR